MDTLYYSNYCKHCEMVKHFLIQKNLVQQLNCICVDRRTVDPQTGHFLLVLENGRNVPLPPNVHRVPTLILRNNFRAIEGEEIIRHYEPTALQQETKRLAPHGGEPAGYDFATASSHSDQFTYTDGRAEDRVSFVGADHALPPIRAPPDDYRPNKVSPDVTVESLEKRRNEAIPASAI